MIKEHFVLFYETVPGFMEKREAFRSTHLQQVLTMYKDRELLMGGAFEGPENQAMLVFNTEEAARRFAETDPYVANGLISKWYIRNWQVVDLELLSQKS